MAFFLGRAGKAQQGLEGLRGPPKSYKARKDRCTEIAPYEALPASSEVLPTSSEASVTV